MFLPLLIAAIVGYLLGSLPFGYLVARAKGVNIFEVGSKNPGATNVRRVLGAGPGNLVFALDALKGAAAAASALLAHTSYSMNFGELGLGAEGRVEGELWTQLGVAGLIGALVGHSFSCFTRFRGGKGVATSVGGLLILMPFAILIAAVTWFTVFFSSRYVSLASISSAVALVAAAWVLRLPSLLLGLALVVATFVILRHITNIKRLLNGTENKFVRKNPQSNS
jgi:acyl phosphate:glycerol-3-phosphate acyltransferase